ncbi:hypothetical protein PNK_0494 [Candidatus Protochlamydia naegleriophila]|uniref:Uncharacterized protein n=1 Tax=Candidatus Protochlamydia naegleriophila TaxID=389348 RepID=A0A0U5JBD1_9BACT|nr:hypothetical protein [Candidatus Protochlamydia naegleriophila]CUI16122.1 hypothetical protein PNK_0494 [Candidatus Protochlamydia naegleriophila]
MTLVGISSLEQPIPIQSLLEIEDKAIIKTTSSDNKVKMLVLDFDHTLAKSRVLSGSDDLNDCLFRLNLKNKVHFNAHASLLFKLREGASFIACENPNKVNSFISRCHQYGWEVIILTARPENMSEMTRRNLEQSRLTSLLGVEIIFSKGPKKDCFYEWLQKHPRWSKVEELDVLFADDKASHCQGMLKLAEVVKKPIKVSVISFHYQRALVSNEGLLTKKQKEVLAVQLLFFRNGKELPEDDQIGTQEINQALKHFSFPDEVNLDSFYQSIRSLASEKGCPFKDNQN